MVDIGLYNQTLTATGFFMTYLDPCTAGHEMTQPELEASESLLLCKAS